jgi:hypothetical protein
MELAAIVVLLAALVSDQLMNRRWRHAFALTHSLPHRTGRL